MILYLRFGGITIFLLGKSDEGLNVYSNFSKMVPKSISSFRRINDCNIIIYDNSGNSVDRLI